MRKCIIAINILLVQPSDPRHVIHTLGRLHRKPNYMTSCKVNVYILEDQAEVLARHILLLYIFLDNLPIRHRAALFLEVFGNSLLQEKTEEYIADAATMLRELINDSDRYSGHLKQLIDFNQMKQRERDDIDNVFKSWTTDTEFDALTLRDHRLRGHYADRYDW